PPTPRPTRVESPAGSTCSTGTARAVRPGSSRRGRTCPMNRDQFAWQTQSALLGYPTSVADELPVLRRVASTLDGAVGEPLLEFIDHASATRASELAADYVATFDQRKRCCLFLTYYAHGDTRRRGMALLTLKQRYAAAGLALRDVELPDHLAVML